MAIEEYLTCNISIYVAQFDYQRHERIGYDDISNLK